MLLNRQIQMTMIEKVARAMYTDYEGGIKLGMKKIMHDTAKAAIEAMREPTEGMKNNYYEMKANKGESKIFSVTGWSMMIKAALKECENEND